MQLRSLLDPAIATLVLAAPLCAAAAGPKIVGALGVISETKKVKGTSVIVCVQDRGKVTIVQILISGAPIKYADIGVVGTGEDGKEIEIKQISPQILVYGTVNGSPSGSYRATLKEGERLAKVKVTMQDESQIFDVIVPDAKPQ